MPLGNQILEHHRGEIRSAASLRFGQSECGVLGSDADVASQGQLAAAGQRVTVDRGNDRLVGFNYDGARMRRLIQGAVIRARRDKAFWRLALCAP